MRRGASSLALVAATLLATASSQSALAQAVVSYIPEPSTSNVVLPAAPIVPDSTTSYSADSGRTHAPARPLPTAPITDTAVFETSSEGRAPSATTEIRPVPETVLMTDTAADPADSEPMRSGDCGCLACGDACASPCGPPGLPVHLPQPCLFQALGIKTSGWVEGGYTANGYDPNDRWNGPVFCNDRSNDFLLNQLWLSMEKPVDTQGCGTDFGGRFDLMYGSDWRYGAAWGLEKRINSPDSLHGLIIPQLYGEIGINRLKIKGGHFATLYGKEWVPSPANFFYSHTLAMAWEPLLVTGVTADYAVNDRLSVNVGTNNGWSMFEDYNNDWCMTAGFNWAPNECTAVRYNIMNGNWDEAGLYNRFGQYLVLDQKLTEKLSYSGSYTFIHEEHGSFTAAGGDAQIHSLAHWLFYSLNEKWTLGARFEWFSNPEGRGVSGIGNWLAYGEPSGTSTAGWEGLPGFEGEFYNFTLGANYRPCPNMVIRPEVRWDWYDGTRNMAPQNALPYNDGTKSNQTLFAVDFIFLF